jgi:CheY-like chemotaxis protein
VNQNNVNTSDRSSKIILLGEDDIDDQEFLKEVLDSFDHSYSLNFENNGRKVVAHLDDLNDDLLPCLIILDYNLPELNAEEILKILNAHKRYDLIPKIVWSTSNSAIYKSKCINLGASDYLVKPRDMASFVKTAKYMFSFCSPS